MHLANQDYGATLGLKAIQERMGLLDWMQLMVNLAHQVHLDHKDQWVKLAPLDHKVKWVFEERKAIWGTWVYLDAWEYWEFLVFLVSQVLKDLRVLKVTEVRLDWVD